MRLFRKCLKDRFPRSSILDYSGAPSTSLSSFRQSWQCTPHHSPNHMLYIFLAHNMQTRTLEMFFEDNHVVCVPTMMSWSHRILAVCQIDLPSDMPHYDVSTGHLSSITFSLNLETNNVAECLSACAAFPFPRMVSSIEEAVHAWWSNSLDVVGRFHSNTEKHLWKESGVWILKIVLARNVSQRHPMGGTM